MPPIQQIKGFNIAQALNGRRYEEYEEYQRLQRSKEGHSIDQYQEDQKKYYKLLKDYQKSLEEKRTKEKIYHLGKDMESELIRHESGEGAVETLKIVKSALKWIWGRLKALSLRRIRIK